MNFPCENYLRFTFNFFSYLFLHFLLGTFPFTFLHLCPAIVIISPAGKMMTELIVPIIVFNFMIFVHRHACLSRFININVLAILFLLTGELIMTSR